MAAASSSLEAPFDDALSLGDEACVEHGWKVGGEAVRWNWTDGAKSANTIVDNPHRTNHADLTCVNLERLRPPPACNDTPWPGAHVGWRPGAPAADTRQHDQ